MKYKVGDIVRLRSDIKLSKARAALCFMEEMREFKGKKLTIAYVLNDCYLIREDGEIWYWTDKMFKEGCEEMNKWRTEHQMVGVEEYFEQKRIKVLEAIEPICEAFGITDYDYIVKEKELTETLRINQTKIGCSFNSTDSVINELVGYIFIMRWRDFRTLGTVDTQAKKIIKRYWIKEEEE